MKKLSQSFAAMAAIAALTLTGCSSSSGTASSSASAAGGSAAFPRDVKIGAATVHLDKAPKAIVCLGPSLTETLYGVGAAAQIVAVDKLSTYPKKDKVSDLDAFKPNVEAIAAKKPDLVLVSDDLNNVVAGLTALKIPVALLVAPKTLDAAYEQFREVAELTGRNDRGATLAAKVKKQIDAAVSSVPTAKGMTFFWELDQTGYSITSDTFIGSVLKQFGLDNIADKAPDPAGGYPQLSQEFVINADPDLIFLADTACCQQSLDTVKARAGWDVTRAVKQDAVIPLDDDVASRWGPRLGRLAQQIAAAVKAHHS